MLGDKIVCKSGATEEVDSIDFLQPEEPRYFLITDATGADRRIQWRGGLWEEMAKLVPVESTQLAPAPAVANPLPERVLSAKDIKLTPYAEEMIKSVEVSKRIQLRLKHNVTKRADVNKAGSKPKAGFEYSGLA